MVGRASLTEWSETNNQHRLTINIVEDEDRPVIPCPACKAQVEPGQPYCRCCRVVLRFESGKAFAVHPPIRPGAVLMTLDLSRERPPGMATGEKELPNGVKYGHHPSGLRIDIPVAKAFESSIPFLRRRDMCVRASLVALDPSAHLQLTARRENIGEASSQYALIVSPVRQAARLVRIVSSVKASTQSIVVDWLTHQAIAPVGSANDMELRVLGPTIEGLVGGQRIFVTHEPTLGVGYPGVRFEAIGQPAHALWLGFEVREVAP
jgi:hypothetical protein